MITARSVDTSGNESADSAAVMVTADALVPAVTDISTTVAINSATIQWTDPTAVDFSHVNITWSPPDGNFTQPLRPASGVQSVRLVGLSGGTEYTVTITSVDGIGHEATAAAAVTPTAATTPAVTEASAMRMNSAGATTVTWVDPATVSDISKIAITAEPGPILAVEVMIGDQTANLVGLDPNVDQIIFISTLDSSDVVTSVTAVIAEATLPVALFRLGGDAVHDGDFGFDACNDELAGNSAVATAMRTAGYTRAVFFGSRRDESPYNFNDLASDTDALGIANGRVSQHEARPVVVYTSANPTIPTTTFRVPALAAHYR